MSVEVRAAGAAPTISSAKGPSGSLGVSGISHVERGVSLGSSFKPMFSISKEGSMTDLRGGNMVKKTSEITTNPRVKSAPEKSSYIPLFSISKDGQMTKLNDLPNANRKTEKSTMTPLRVESSSFSQDTIAPKADRKSSENHIVLYKRSEAQPKIAPKMVGEQTFTQETNSSNLPPVEQFDVRKDEVRELTRTAEITPAIKTLGSVSHKPESIVAAKPVETTTHERTSINEVNDKKAQEKQSTWQKKQASLVLKRAQAITVNPKTKPSVAPEVKANPDAFAKALINKSQAREKVVERPDALQILQPATLQVLETQIKPLVREQSVPTRRELTELASKVQQATEVKIGKLEPELVTTTFAKPAESVAVNARMEISTMLQDGALVTRKMTEILISQGVEPKVAHEKALEQTTQTIVRTIKVKGLAKRLEQIMQEEDFVKQKEQEEIMTEPDIQEESEDLREGKGVVTAVRDNIADSNRVTVARDIGVELLTMARQAGQSSIDLSAVADSMPEAPGEAMASYIRTQLRLHLNSEEQYDAFNDVLGKMGTVSSELEIRDAAIVATNMAPSVRLAKDGEPVLPVDVDSALRNGNKIRKFVRIIKETITATVSQVSSSVTSSVQV